MAASIMESGPIGCRATIAEVGGVAEHRGLGRVGADQDRVGAGRWGRKRVGKGFPLQGPTQKARIEALYKNIYSPFMSFKIFSGLLGYLQRAMNIL